MNGIKAFKRAIAITGSQVNMAKAIGKKQAHVSMWIKRGKVPAEVCRLIEQATNGVVTRYELREDVFGNGHD